MIRQAGMATLLRMRLRMLGNHLRGFTWRAWLKAAMVSALTLGFLLGEGLLAVWLFGSLRGKEDLAAFFVVALGERLLSLVFLVSLSMLFFSNVTTSLATIYLSRDLDRPGDVRVFRQHRNGFLADDRSAVDALIDEVDGAARDLHAVVE